MNQQVTICTTSDQKSHIKTLTIIQLNISKSKTMEKIYIKKPLQLVENINVFSKVEDDIRRIRCKQTPSANLH